MQLQLNRVHEYKKVNDGSRPTLTKINPATRLGRRGEGIDESVYVFIQGGLFFSEGGARIKTKDLPPWLDDEIKRMSREARAEVGLPVDWKPGWRPDSAGLPAEDDEDD